jgi:hydroxyacylglutathione hydrolase
MLKVKVFPFSPIQENTYLVFDTQGNALVIDPGCYSRTEEEKMAQFILAQGLTPRMLLNTHCHLDHVFGNRWVHQQYGLELHLHEGEKEMLSWAPLSGEKWGLPFVNYDGPLHFIQPGDTILCGNDALTVLFTPGHSPASVCFYCADQGFLLGGDVLFRESIGRTDLPGGDHATLLESIRTALFTLPDETIVYPGHGIPTTIGHEKRNNPFLQS